MRVRYQVSKGNRIKKGTFKQIGYNKQNNIFIGVTTSNNNNTLYWGDTAKIWGILDNTIGEFSNCNTDIHNLKQFIRHILKHNYLPKGTKFCLRSKLEGYDIVIIRQ